MINQEKLLTQLSLAAKYLLSNQLPEGIVIVITSYKITPRSKTLEYGFHFEPNTIKTGDIIKRENGLLQKVEYVMPNSNS